MTGPRARASTLLWFLAVAGSAGGAELRIVNNPTLGGFLDLSDLETQVIDVGQDGVAVLPIAAFSGNYLLHGPFTVGQNGGVGFGETCQGNLDPENQPIPSQGAFGGAQATLVLWDDIDDKGGDIGFALLGSEGTPPNTVIIQWSSPNFDGAGSNLWIQLQILDNQEPTGIYARYVYRIKGPSASAGESATIGYQDGFAGFGDIQYSVDASNVVTDGTVLTLLIPLPADLDGDGSIDVSDILLLLAQWGPCPDCHACSADLDGDCNVGIGDLAQMFSSWE